MSVPILVDFLLLPPNSFHEKNVPIAMLPRLSATAAGGVNVKRAVVPSVYANAGGYSVILMP